MFGPELQSAIEKQTGSIHDYTPLFGGDMHLVLKLQTDNGPWVAKVASTTSKIGSLKAEYKGLQLLASTNTFKTPELAGEFTTPSSVALVMRYVESTPTNSSFWDDFAQQLSQLHSNSHQNFGLDHDNYIGALPQQNSWQKSAADHYILDRIEPQIAQAHDAGYTLKTDAFYKNLEDLITQETPALIHGDLWNGNYLASSQGAVLIDPAVSYGIALMDLAMMDLFGGFPDRVFTQYGRLQKLPPSWRSSLDIYQLYYLLVHLNLFGASYLAGVKRILTKYS
ncbi:fructosamine kinase family protein [Gilvibacter sediminis]|uniref:fructosamine kinase family protein n=1 Tax=Gilvibacter sediminis TaxID=379071 RepID=UPI002350532D|nr:fructosamine kinase family protein [Gilvibacter sediminis]MDC7998728.1 fructosamine kinase family protein [Gilvibacter sediminis]